MQTKTYLFALFLMVFVSCRNDKKSTLKTLPKNTEAKTIKDIQLPEGYSRIQTKDSSFGDYLQTLGLKKDNTVYLYNGEKKGNQNAQYAVVDISVGTKDLQQCADAVMRLRSEYLYKYKKYDSIVFYDNEKTKYAFTAPYTRENFDKYLLRVFGMCGSKSLEMQLKSKIDLAKIEIGDVWIKGGFPGHAVLVVDIAVNDAGEKIFMIAQSFMPAQNVHILKNHNSTELSPWFSVQEIGDQFDTPEYTFTKNQLRTWH